MKLPGIRSYPKEIQFGDEIYKIRFVRKLDHPDNVGECCSGTKEIRIKLGLSRHDTLKTFIHELIHLIEFELPVDIKHNLVYKLESSIFELLIRNF